MRASISINSFKMLQCRFVPQGGAFSPKVCRDSLRHRLAFWHLKPKTVTKEIRNERPHWAGLLSGLYSLFSTKYLPFSWTCHHLYQPLFKPWPWTDGPKPLPFNTNCCPTNICYIYGRRAPRAHQDTCLTLWGDLGNFDRSCSRPCRRCPCKHSEISCFTAMLHCSDLAFEERKVYWFEVFCAFSYERSSHVWLSLRGPSPCLMGGFGGVLD